MEETNNYKCKSCAKETNDKVNIQRFIDNLDKYFKTNDLKGANEYLLYWVKEARNLNDKRGLLSVLNETIGFVRRTNNKELGLTCIDEALLLLKEIDVSDTPSGAVIYTNIATTLNAFDRVEESLPLYEKAEQIMLSFHESDSYEYAAMLNNKSTAFMKLENYGEAKKCINKAIEVLKTRGDHDAEIALSYINLAHVTYDSDSTSTNEVEKYVDFAWDFINSDKNIHDANYAYVLTKCAPSFRYFKRELEAQALEETAKEIYEGK